MFASGQTRDWRDLTPLSSTRVDVERILGEPNESSTEFSVFYRTSTETIIINYTQGLPCGAGKPNRWKVPKNVIESMLVTPLKSLRLSQLPFDLSKFVTSHGVERPEDTVYSDEENGLSIRTFRDEVTTISLSSGSRDMHLLCTNNQLNVDRACHGPIPLLWILTVY